MISIYYKSKINQSELDLFKLIYLFIIYIFYLEDLYKRI